MEKKMETTIMDNSATTTTSTPPPTTTTAAVSALSPGVLLKLGHQAVSNLAIGQLALLRGP